MPKFLSLLLPLTLLASPMAHAGFERGNGGNIVFCANETEPMFLDYYIYIRSEKKLLFPILSPMNTPAIEKALQLIQPLNVYDSLLTERLASAIRSFEKESYFINDMPRVVVADEGLRALIETYQCNIHQLIFQRDLPTAEGIRYFVSEKHWKMLNDDQKATALVHEAVLREFMGKEDFFYKDPVQIIVEGLLAYEMFRDKSGLERAKLQFSVLKEF